MSKKFLEGLLPYPRKIEEKSGSFNLMNAKTAISDNVEKSFDFWLGKLGITFTEKKDFDGRYVITIGEAGEFSVPIFKNDEAYRIEVSERGVVISANSEMGLSFALRTLVKINKLENKIPALIIDDEPQVELRAIHMCVFDFKDGSEKDDTSPEALMKRIELAALLGYNHVFVEFWGMFPYKKHPYACHPYTTYTRDVVEKIVDFCINDLHITPCPGQNLTSHAGWSRIVTRRHVVLDQRPDLVDMYIPGGWCFATENPKTKEFLRDLIDDLVETFKNPPMLHMCCDKAFGFGSTEEDRTKSADVLFAQHIANLNTYITSKGVRPVMWADMLYSSMDSLTFKAAPFVADVLPKNILMDVWTHNDPGEYWHDVDFFEEKGYQTVYSPFINYDSIKNMIKLCIKKKSKGIVQTTWHKPEFAKPYFTYSIAKQWNFDCDVNENKVCEFLQVFG